MNSTNKKAPGARGGPQPFNQRAGHAPQIRPAVAQLKTAVSSQSAGRPVAPPVYRPQALPKAVQPKMANGAVGRNAPTAPPVYHPQPVPKVLQTKTAAARGPHAGQPPRQPVAPPAYRPEAKKIVQPKAVSPTAPPVYRPEQKRVAQPQMATVASAHTPPEAHPVYRPQPQRVSAPPRTPAQMKSNVVVPQAHTPKTARQQKTDNAAGARTPGPHALALNRQDWRVRPANGRPESIQRYTVLPPEHLMSEMPALARKSEPNYPYAVVVPGVEFIAQQSLPCRHGSDKGHDFLREPFVGCQEAWIVGRTRQSLRLSDDGNMAIEDTDLLGRQPKEFYAASGVIRASNQALERVGAHVNLVQGAHAMTVVTARKQVIALYTVTPHFTKLPPQNCNAMAGVVGGWDPAWTSTKTGVGLKKVNEMLGYTDLYNSYNRSKSVTELEMEELQDKIAAAYVVKSKDSQLTSKAQINQYAAPGVGEAFMMVTLGKSTKIDAKTSKVFDYETGQDRLLKWRYHFGGVVAVSGNDRITLENFARGDGRENDPDPRWYFQMYGGSSGQTFYDYNKATAGFSNPVAVVV